MTLGELRARCLSFAGEAAQPDHAHALDHVERVLRNTEELTASEQADAWITVPAACLHDCVSLPKDSPQRSQASRLAAAAAAEFLTGIEYPAALIPAVAHAIEAHSYSAGIPPHSLEAKVVQDADRLDALGAIGIARCLLVGGQLRRPLWAGEDPFCDERSPDDARFTLDHFYAKLLKLPATMQTGAGRAEAQRRAAVMQRFLDDLRREIL
jgi:uncharacterized protein